MRSRSLAWSGLLVGGVAAMIIAAQGWWTVEAADFSGTVSGTDATGTAAMVLAVVVAAGLLLMLTLRHRGRQVVGGVLAVVAAGMVLVGVRNPEPGQSLIDAARSGHTLETRVELGATPWPWVYAVAGLLILAAAVLTVIKAPSWPRPVDRYARLASRADTRAEDDPSEVWKAMDAGYDPTDDEAK